MAGITIIYFSKNPQDGPGACTECGAQCVHDSLMQHKTGRLKRMPQFLKAEVVVNHLQLLGCAQQTLEGFLYTKGRTPLKGVQKWLPEVCFVAITAFTTGESVFPAARGYVAISLAARYMHFDP